jgi:hypothetical protein
VQNSALVSSLLAGAVVNAGAMLALTCFSPDVPLWLRVAACDRSPCRVLAGRSQVTVMAGTSLGSVLPLPLPSALVRAAVDGPPGLPALHSAPRAAATPPASPLQSPPPPQPTWAAPMTPPRTPGQQVPPPAAVAPIDATAWVAATLQRVPGLDVAAAAVARVVCAGLAAHAVLQQAGLAPQRGIVLHGPPGCGKTALAHALAQTSGLPYCIVPTPDLFDKGARFRLGGFVLTPLGQTRARASAPCTACLTRRCTAPPLSSCWTSLTRLRPTAVRRPAVRCPPITARCG